MLLGNNAVARVLVQRARFSFPLQVWMEFVPLDLNSSVLTNLPVHE